MKGVFIMTKEIKVAQYDQIGYVENDYKYILKCNKYDNDLVIGQRTVSGTEILLSIRHDRVSDETIDTICARFGFKISKVY
jgi:hypothetical protein